MLSLLLITALAVQYPPASKPADTTSRSRQPAAAQRDTNRAAAVSRAAFHDAMRELWTDHVVYHRNSIISAAAGLPDTAHVAQRLLRNQDDIGNAIKPYYGDAAGNQLAALLRGHIQHAGRVVMLSNGQQHAMHAGYAVQDGKQMDVRSGDTTKLRNADTTEIKRGQYPTAVGRDTARVQNPTARMADTSMVQDRDRAQNWAQSTDSTALNSAVAALRANADSIATFLSSANPRNWSRATLQGALQMHVNLLLQEATTRLRGDWAANIAAFDASSRQALQMADMLSDGIIKQFPNRFTNKATTMSSLQ